jgi:hypothetical protein
VAHAEEIEQLIVERLREIERQLRSLAPLQRERERLRRDLRAPLGSEALADSARSVSGPSHAPARRSRDPH